MVGHIFTRIWGRFVSEKYGARTQCCADEGAKSPQVIQRPTGRPGSGRRRNGSARNNKQLHNEELSPLRTSSRCSNVSNLSDQQNTANNTSYSPENTANNISYSPEDTINNDFFYDDEFSVPFDANLGELDQDTGVDMGMLEAVDINTLLTLSRVGPDDNQKYLDRLSSSKSDSCLYQADMGVSTGSDLGDTSIEQSTSDPEFGSSSELSDLRSEPLFSPPPGSTASDANIQELSTDSLGRSEVFSSSVASGDGRYTYDWTANRDQYMLSFVAPSRASDDDSSSYHDSMPSDARESLGSWAQHSNQSLWSSCNSCSRMTGSGRMTGSAKTMGSGRMAGSGRMMSSGRMTSSGRVVAGHKFCDSPLAASPSTTPQNGSPKRAPRPAKPEPPLTTWAAKKEKPPSTTWARLRESKEMARIEKGMTSWKDLMDTKQQMREEASKPRSKSMSDLKTKQFPQMNEQHPNSENREEELINDEVRGQPEGQAEEETPQNKRYSTSLFELFQRLRSHCGEEEARRMETLIFNPEPDIQQVSSSALQLLTGTWSMSPCSDRSQWSQLQTSSGSGSGSSAGLVSWSALKNSLKDSHHEVDSLCSSMGRESLMLSHSDKLNKLSQKCATHRLQCSLGCNTSVMEMLNASAQAGSDLLTLSKVFGCNKRDVGVQFSPEVQDCCVQAVLIDNTACVPKVETTKSKEQQTTWREIKKNPQPSLIQHDSPIKRIGAVTVGNLTVKQMVEQDLQRTNSKENMMVCSVDQGLQRSKEKESLTSMNRDTFYTKCALPDLSFLNTNMTTSATLEQFLGDQLDFIKEDPLRIDSDPLFNLPEAMLKSPPSFMKKPGLVTNDVDVTRPPPKPPRLHGRTVSLDRKDTPPKPRERSPPRPQEQLPPKTHRSSSPKPLQRSPPKPCERSPHKQCEQSPPKPQERSPPKPRERSPVTNRLKIQSRLRLDSGSTNSVCSSSSSGIDPGSYDSAGNQADCNSNTSESEPDIIMDRKPSFRCLKEKRKHHVKLGLRSLTRPEIQRVEAELKQEQARQESLKELAPTPTKTVNQNAREAKKMPEPAIREGPKSGKPTDRTKSKIPVLKTRQSIGNNNMVESHPKYHKPRYVRTGDMKQVDYLQVSPTHIPVRGKKKKPQLTDKPESKKNTSIPTCSKLEGSQKPLKSCLVKRRKGGNRNRQLFKQRAYSDPHDLTVMKYSQEGQTRYQLITPPSKIQECQHGLNVAAGLEVKEDKEDVNIASSLPESLEDENPRPDTCEGAAQTQPAQGTSELTTCKSGTSGLVVPSSVTVNSPDIIPAIPCPCQSGYSDISLTSPATSPCTETCNQRTKKSVSFSKEIFYHSPSSSPNTSPKKQLRQPLTTPSTCSTPRLPVSGSQNMVQLSSPDCAGVVEGEEPPCDFTVSPTSSADDQNLQLDGTMVDAAQKRDLLLRVVKGAEVILAYFSKTRDPNEKALLASTAHSPEVGHLIVTHLCPAMYALLQDGLKPQVRSLFGKIKNSVWKVVEDSAELGPSTRVVNELVQELKGLDYLNAPGLRFNAFIFGLLNRKALDFWLTYMQGNESLLKRHYEPESFLLLSTSTAPHLFLDMTTALQPLAQLPFRIQYDFQPHLQGCVINTNTHVSHSLESSMEGKPHTTVHASNSAQDFASCSTPTSPMDGLVNEQGQPGVGKQTRDILHSGSKKLLGKLQEHTNVLSFDSLQTLLGGRGVKSPSGSGCSMAVPQLQGINDQAGMLAEEEEDEEIGEEKHAEKTQLSNCVSSEVQAVKIVQDNMILEGGMDESLEPRPPPAGFLNRMAQQIKELASPEKVPVYKRGVTEYQFDGEAVGGERDVTGGEALSGEREGRMVRTVSRSGGLSQELVYACSAGNSATQSYTDSGIDVYKSDTPPVEFTIPTRQRRARVDPMKRWSDSSATRTLSLTGTRGAEVGMREVKKRWSSFGPSLINMFDKLLLDGNRDVECSGSTTPSSSGISSPHTPSMSRDTSQELSLNTTRKRNSGTFPHHRLSREDSGNVTSTESLHSRASDGYRDKFETLPEVQALCHHIASDDQQLSFEKGDVLEVVKKMEGDWLLCHHSNNTGLVHNACVRGLPSSASDGRISETKT